MAIRDHAADAGRAPDIRLSGLARPVAMVLKLTALDTLFPVVPMVALGEP